MPCRACGAASTIVGELVAEGGNQFRIVGQGSYRGPARNAVAALDGKTVQVELASNRGRVDHGNRRCRSIRLSHGWSTVRGQLLVTDAASRTFTFAGDTQIYIAPPTIDIALYDGKQVEAKIDEHGRVTELQAGRPRPRGGL